MPTPRSLAQLLDDGLEYTHSNGDLDTKTSFIDSLVTGKRDYISSVATIETVRIFGDVGVIRGKAKVTVGGKDRQPAGPAHRLHRHLAVERRALADDGVALHAHARLAGEVKVAS